MIEQASLVIGNDNFAVKENSFLGYAMNQGFYVPREMDVVRATTATLVNSDGLIEPVAYNLYLRSEEFDNASWVKSNATVTANATNSPIGNLTSDKVIASATTSTHFIVQQPAGAVSGVTATISIFAKASELSRIQLLNNGGGLGVANYNLSTGTSTLVSGVSASIENYGNGWYRCIMSYIPTITGSYNIQIRLSDNSGNTTFLGNGTDGLFLWGAQLVTGTSAKAYFPTTDRLDVPRVDYSNGTPSILVEPQRTNLALQSSSFDSASWSKVGVTISANTTASPSGVADADKMIENVGSSSKYLSSSSFSANTYTASVYVKPSNKTFFWMSLDSSVTAVFFNLTTGTIAATGSGNTGTIASVGNGWFRCTITRTNVSTQSLLFGTSDSSANYISNGNGVDGVFLWGAQLEAGSNATSYIPTIASTVTRNADVISKTGISSLIGQTEGVIFLDAIILPATSANLEILSLNDGTNNNRLRIITATSQRLRFIFQLNGGITQYDYTFETSFTQQTRLKIAISYKSGNTAIYINGIKVNISTNSLTISNTLSVLNLGNNVGALYEAINSAQLYKTQLTDQECINLTTI